MTYFSVVSYKLVTNREEKDERKIVFETPAEPDIDNAIHKATLENKIESVLKLSPESKIEVTDIKSIGEILIKMRKEEWLSK